MDKYTELTKNWLEDRYSQVDKNGIFIAHQPIYGFRKGNSDPSLLGRYIITYQIMKALSGIKFNSLLDVGGAEGYKAALIKEIFNVEVCNNDLSEVACRRAEAIFNIRSVPGDIHKLPFNNEEFDIVLCSETLEHVTDIKRAVNELLRVAKSAVVITVPHDSPEVINKNIKNKVPHAHIHALNENSFEFVKEYNYEVKYCKYYHKSLKIISLLIDGVPRKDMKNIPNLGIKVYNFLMKISKYIFGVQTFKALIKFDDSFTKEYSKYYNGLCFIISKKKNIYIQEKSLSFLIKRILEFKVPFYFLKNNG